MSIQDTLMPGDDQRTHHAGQFPFYVKPLTSFVVSHPEELPNDQRLFLVRHLEFSSALKELHCRGEAIIRGLFMTKMDRKTASGRNMHIIKNMCIRTLVRGIRRFTKYELLRSSLEGLLYEQVPYLDEPIEKRFRIEGINQSLLMTHVYFSRSYWEFYSYDKEAVFDKCLGLTEGDTLLILGFLNSLETLMWAIKKFTDDYRGRDRLKWRQRLRSNIRSILKAHTTLKVMLMEHFKEMLLEDGSLMTKMY